MEQNWVEWNEKKLRELKMWHSHDRKSSIKLWRLISSLYIFHKLKKARTIGNVIFAAIDTWLKPCSFLNRNLFKIIVNR